MTSVRNHRLFLCIVLDCQQVALARHNLFFNPEWRSIADAEWAIRLAEKRVRMGVLRQFTSVFTDSGLNMSFSSVADLERRKMRSSAPLWARTAGSLVLATYRVAKLLQGCYSQHPFEYSVFTGNNPNRRTKFTVHHPTFVWKGRFQKGSWLGTLSSPSCRK